MVQTPVGATLDAGGSVSTLAFFPKLCGQLSG
jgi:hypothetical protein